MKTCYKKMIIPISKKKFVLLKQTLSDSKINFSSLMTVKKFIFEMGLKIGLALSLSLPLPAYSQSPNTSSSTLSLPSNSDTYSSFPKDTVIENLYQVAELEFVEGDLTKSLQAYQKITDSALDESWSEPTRRLIFQSYFRMAQLQKDQETTWVEKAYIFASDLTPDSNITPLGLKNLYQSITQNQDIILLPLEKLNNKTINGSKNLFSVHKHKIYRVDINTQEGQSSVHFVKGEKILNFTPEKQNPTVSKEPALPQTLPAKKKFTYVNNNMNIRDNLNSAETPSSFQEALQDLNAKMNFQGGLVSKGPLKKDSKKKNRWLYIASTALAVTLGAMLVYQNNDKSSNYEPAKHQGF